MSPQSNSRAKETLDQEWQRFVDSHRTRRTFDFEWCASLDRRTDLAIASRTQETL